MWLLVCFDRPPTYLTIEIGILTTGFLCFICSPDFYRNLEYNFYTKIERDIYSLLKKTINKNERNANRRQVYLQVQNSLTEFEGVWSGLENCPSRHVEQLKLKLFSGSELSHLLRSPHSSWAEFSCTLTETEICQGPPARNVHQKGETFSIFERKKIFSQRISYILFSYKRHFLFLNILRSDRTLFMLNFIDLDRCQNSVVMGQFSCY